MILALTSTGDITTDYVVRALQVIDQDVIRVNTDTFLEKWSITDDSDGITVGSEERCFRNTDVSSVYYRRAKRPVPHPETHRDAQLFAYREARVALRGLYSQLICPWISHYFAVSASENRLAQMHLAQKIGFMVPPWISTNSPADAYDFFRARGMVVAKPLAYGALGSGNVVHTNLISHWEEDFASEIRTCPTLLQTFVAKRFDYRITVVDSTVFSCRIDSQQNPAYSVDMRRGLVDLGMHHAACTLPRNIEVLCVEIVARLGLRFGAIDLVEDEDGVFWFLEVNPTGQWAWIEDRTGLGISNALAGALARA